MFSLFLANRFYRGDAATKQSASSPAIRVAIAGVAVGVIVMLVTVSVVAGFKREVQQKVSGFMAHMEVLDVLTYATPEDHAIEYTPEMEKFFKNDPRIKHVQQTALKMGILKTETDFSSLQFKGYKSDFDSAFIRSCVTEGRLPNFASEESGNEILVSQTQADELKLKVGDRIFAYFFEETIKTRRFTICGIYSTHMSIFDKNFVLTDFATISHLNHWNDSTNLVRPVSSLELNCGTADPDLLLNVQTDLLRFLKKSGNAENGPTVVTVREHFPQIFSWLGMLDFNSLVILILMICVAGVTMVSGLLVLILERTATIGILKALGARNKALRHTFLWFAARIILKGMVIGNALAFTLLALQYHYHLIPLNPQNYYVDCVPVEFVWLEFLLVNVGTLILTTLALILPSFVVSRIQPAKAIKFD